MSRLGRYTQSLFGSSAGANQMAEFGSLAAGTPARYSGSTITPAIIQTLSNYLQGWFGAVEAVNSPSIEDMNALCYLYAYQLAYLFQEGVPEWDANTNYTTGSIVTEPGSGQMYISQTTNNLNQSLFNNPTWWKVLGGQGRTVTVNTNLNNQIDDVVRSDSTAGNLTHTLPLIADIGWGCRITVKDVGTGAFSTTVKGAGSDQVEGASSYEPLNQNESATFYNNGTSWDVI